VCSELKERLGTDDIIAVLWSVRLRRYGRVSRQDENDWVKMHGVRNGWYKTQRRTKENVDRICGKRLLDPKTKQERCCGENSLKILYSIIPTNIGESQ